VIMSTPPGNAIVAPAAVHSISVVICTFNRAGLLQQTLSAVRECAAPSRCDVEIVVIDNNSTDDTPEVVRRAAGSPGYPIRYAAERKQGKSFALNRALSLARGEVIALTDDDVLPARDWLTLIAARLRSEPIAFAFGKVLPRWAVLPPPELLTFRARSLWGPLALIDYGDESIRYTPAAFRTLRMPIGANLAVRRDALDRVGPWRTDLGRVDNSPVCGEDRELCVRLFRARLYDGVYDPRITVQHYVPETRLGRRYFRRWFYWHGRTMARMADSFFVDLDLREVPHIARVPRFIYRELTRQVKRWLLSLCRRDAFNSLTEELQLLQYFGFVAECWHPYREQARVPDADHGSERGRPAGLSRQEATWKG
jgi:glycosyltransferase involved in cell wall biosynthesis